MIGLIVHITETDLAKIWSISSRRHITYSRCDLPSGCREGDWINVKFDDNGILQRISRIRSMLETRWDERGELQVLDEFLFIHNREEVVSQHFGVVRLEKGRNNGRWTEEEHTRDQTFPLWMTISAKAQFSIEEQSLGRTNYKERKYSDTYEKLMDLANEMKSTSSSSIQRNDFIREKILLVGFSEHSSSFFSVSHCGEAVVPPRAWKRHANVQLGDVFYACIRPIKDDALCVNFKVENLEKRNEVWEGVKVNVSEKDVRVELDGKIVRQLSSCFALDTIPFGLITYPIDLGLASIPEDVYVGEHLRVRINRFRSSKPDHPSKFQVTHLLKRIPVPVKTEGWVEGIVTCIHGNRVFLSFEEGNALYMNRNSANLSLGTIIDICVKATEDDSSFEVTNIDDTARRRDDISVEMSGTTSKPIFTVICVAKIVGRKYRYFILQAPIIGIVVFYFAECPKNMRVGEIWEVKMHRRKEKRDLPTHWVAHGTMSEHPRCAPSTEKQRDSVIGKSEKEESVCRSEMMEDDGEWVTIIITGSENDYCYGSCSLADTVAIPYSLVGKLKVLDRGAFYRIKCAKENNLWWAYKLDPVPIHLKEFETTRKRSRSLHVWCYARVDRKKSTSFTLFNEILGEATLPHRYAKSISNMKVGDKIEALYYRVVHIRNPTQWMVKRIGEISENSIREQEYKYQYYDNEEEREDEEDEEQFNDYEIKSEGCRALGEPSKLDRKPKKDRRVLDLMQTLVRNPKLQELINNSNAEDFQLIRQILAKDRFKLKQ